jgi:hypothetical protein
MLTHLYGEPISGRLVYRRADRSFDTEPTPPEGYSSLLINDAQIEVNDEGRLLYVWGYCPHESWDLATLDPPTAKPGLLRYLNWAIVPGVSKQLNENERWPISYDPSSHWLCIGSAADLGEMIAFAPGSIAALRDGDLIGLWLHLDAWE